MKAGSIVICIDDSNWVHDISEYFKILPVSGKIYRISAIHPNYSRKGGPPGVSVEGIVGKIHEIKTYWGSHLPIECHFRMNRFREIDLLSDNVELLGETEDSKFPIEKENVFS
jgi:hypothetical protein